MTRPMIFTVDASLLEDLNKRPDDVRQKMLFDFRSYTAQTVEVTRGGETFSFGKEAGATQPDGGVGADIWKQTAPSAREVELTKMTDFLVDLANLKAETFADRALTSGDEYVFTVRFGDQTAPTEERITIRRSGATVHGIRQGEPGAAVVPTADFQKVLDELTAVLEAP
jgi:hypothetical protein